MIGPSGSTVPWSPRRGGASARNPGSEESIPMPFRAVIVLLVVFLFSPAPAICQVRPNASSPTISHQRRFPQVATASLAGQVVMENGSPLDRTIQVELVCNGRIKQQAQTAPDGSFYLDLGAPRTEDWLDPGMGGSSDGTVEGSVKVAAPSGPAAPDEIPSMGQGRTTLYGCEVRAAPVPGFVSNTIALGTRSVFDNPEIGRIIIRKLNDPDARTVSLSTLTAPRNAREAFQKASEELENQKPNTDRAMKELHKALKAHPEFSAAWDLLARVQIISGDPVGARESFLRAVEVEPGFLQPYMGLAQMAVQRSDWKETAAWSRKVLQLDQGSAPALYWHGLASYYMSDFVQGESSLSRLYELGYRDEYPFGLLPLGVIHANQGQIQSAAEELQLYLKIMPPDLVSAAQRAELERQLEQWETSGLASLSQEALGTVESP